MSIWNLSNVVSDTPLSEEKPVSGLMGLIYGLHVYTTFIWPANENVWKQHWERLKQNAAAMDLAFDFDEQAVLKQIEAVFSPETPVLRLAVIANTTEYREFWTEPAQKLPSRLILSARPLSPSLTDITLQTAVYERPMPLIKAAAMAESILLKRKAIAGGAHEVLFLGKTGEKAEQKAISEADRMRQRIHHLRSPSWEIETQAYFLRECGMANIFVLETNPNPFNSGEFSHLRLRTPNPERDGCLPGITRQQVLDAAAHIGLVIYDDGKPLLLSSLLEVQGVFIGNAASGLNSVSCIQHSEGDKPLNLAIHWTSEAKACLEHLRMSF